MLPVHIRLEIPKTAIWGAFFRFATAHFKLGPTAACGQLGGEIQNNQVEYKRYQNRWRIRSPNNEYATATLSGVIHKDSDCTKSLSPSGFR